MVDVRHSILIKIIALSAGKTLSVDELTEHLEMPSSFWRLTDTYLDCARAPSQHCPPMPVQSSKRYSSDDEVGHPPSIPSC